MPGILEAIDADLIEPHRLAGAVVDQLRIERRKPADKRHGITAREAFSCLCAEADLLIVAAENLANGVALSDDDRVRLRLAGWYVHAIRQEFMR